MLLPWSPSEQPLEASNLARQAAVDPERQLRDRHADRLGLFSSSIADAGQAKGDRRLVGWVYIDAYHKGKPDAQGPVST